MQVPFFSSNPTDTVEFNWDNKLHSATKSGTTLNVKYDPLGNRVWRQVDTGTTVTTKKYILDIAGGLPVILCVLDDTGSLETSYVHTPHTAQVLSKREHNTSDPLLIDHHRLYVHDRLGSVRLMLDDDGSIQNAYTYDARITPLKRRR